MIRGLDDDLPKALTARLTQPLPGIGRCNEFAPELCYGRHQGPPAHDARAAAVLVLLYRTDDKWRVPLMVRPETMPLHAGQVSFPGGEIEQGETVEQAALRECHEELGDAGAEVQMLGRLSPVYVFASNFLVTPCVAWSPTRPNFQPNPEEVANLLETPLVELSDRRPHGSHVIERRGVRFRAPHVHCQDYQIWGATSLILAELFLVLADAYS